MGKNFDKQSADKAWIPRPRNVAYEPHQGDRWLFFDADTERMEVEWLVELLDGPNAKQTGNHPGYRVSYPLKKMEGRRWKPLTTTGEITYLWACPGCGESKPIAYEDYICGDCRTSQESLDSETPNPYNA
jgi:hypothetical protein